jgi:hypothetical protein
MSMLPRKPTAQLPLLAYLYSKPPTCPSWAAVSTDAQQKILQLLAQLLRSHCARCRAEIPKEVDGE